ncbi:uncharacterized protein LOC110713227 [Chenopodium quinoa]|uniref:uncharacterized protein LOC110713227 n=1 Tax=Chenopodium quinoa TaxID=63459 RepID=UPI000B7707B0|nr:uncharacterized protein LOC110713227 [Chenopodium quinoa]
MKLVFVFFIISFLAFSNLISVAKSSSPANHDASFKDETIVNKTSCNNGQQLSSNENGNKVTNNNIDWGNHAIHAYRRQGGRGGRGTGGGGNLNNRAPTTRKSNAAPWLVNNCFFFAYVTFAYLVFQI